MLRRAAEASEEAGNDLRALALARSAADLATEMGSALPPPASHSAPTSHSPPASHSAPPPNLREELEIDLHSLLDSGRATRVWVKRSARDEGLYIVRRTGSDKPGYDVREAVVVLLEPDADFFGTK